MSFFFKDSNLNLKITWEKLLEDINQIEEYNLYSLSDNYYEIFKKIIVSILLNKEIILLDSDFSKDEINILTGNNSIESFTKKIDTSDLKEISSKDKLISKLNSPNKNWRITLFTSGTTGLPKKVSHNFSSISRFVRLDHPNDVWGFAYNPTHMAGVQVFFQALLNGNFLVRLFNIEKETLLNEIEDNKITHISATPSFYNLLFPTNRELKSVKRITSGGERFNPKLFEKLNHVFPNAKFNNIYASTEAGSLLVSSGEYFTIKPDFEDEIKISDNQLLIKSELLGDNELQYGEWYNTGDIVEVTSNTPLTFKIVNRESDLINIGGYKVNPVDVENVLNEMPEIKSSRVYGKPNSVLGNILCADVVKSSEATSDSEIREYLKNKLQEFKIPRIFKFVDDISKTRTGKIKR